MEELLRELRELSGTFCAGAEALESFAKTESDADKIRLLRDLRVAAEGIKEAVYQSELKLNQYRWLNGSIRERAIAGGQLALSAGTEAK